MFISALRELFPLNWLEKYL